nr:nicotinate-nucleotide--dimethylbenzimidazole phosphoribosyltransferase [Streptomyces sp. S1D4-11]
MTDTGQVPGEGLPENAGMVEQPGVPAQGAYTFLDPSENPAEDDDLLLMPGAQGAWGNEVAPPPPQPLVQEQPLVHEPGPHETAGRDSGSLDLSGVRVPGPVAAQQPTAPRRPLHLGPPTPDGSASPVRSLADRGPAAAPVATPMNPATPPTPVRHAGPPTAGPEYLDVPQLSEIPPQGAVPWGAPPVGPEGTAAETVVPSAVRGPEAGVVAEAVTVPEAAPVAEVPEAVEAAEFAPVPQLAEAVEAVGAQGLAQVPQAPETAQTPEASEGRFVQQAVEVAPSPEAEASLDAEPSPEAEPSFEAAPGPEATPAPDGFPAPEAPEATPASTPFPVAQDLPHAAPTVDDTAGHLAKHPGTGFRGGRALGGRAGAPARAGPAVDARGRAGGHRTGSPTRGPGRPLRRARRPGGGPGAPVPGSRCSYPGTRGPVGGQRRGGRAARVRPGAPRGVRRPGSRRGAGAGGARRGRLVRTGGPRRRGLPGPGRAVRGPRRGPRRVRRGRCRCTGRCRRPHTGAARGHEPVARRAPPRRHGRRARIPGRPLDSAADQPLGQFVPVEGTVPTTPHLAPTPPHAMTVPPLPTEERPPAEEPPALVEAVAAESQEAHPAPLAEAEPAIEAPLAPVPAPREAEAETPPVPEPFEADPEPVVVAQQADDLDTQVADQEESPAAVEDVRESTGPAAPGYDDAEREAVLRVMRERRDIRNGFRSDPIPHDVLLRVLEAAHTAPSVGHSQPWDFVVIRSAETRRTMHELAARQREAYAKSLPKGRAKQFKELKIEAILDTPVNIVVTADPTRGGRHTLGRHTQPQMAPYSSALAVQNLWLAARAEGLGVGWVSFFDEREMVRALGLPEHLDVVAYLCVGYVDEFPEEPELMQAGWSKRRPLSWVVHEETYGRRALPGEEPHDLLAETVSNIRPLDAKALGEAWERQKRMTKPAGALGMLEIISAQLSGLSRMCPPPIPEPAAVAIFAGDHGVHAQGVTPWPQEVTGQMVANFLGGGAVCNAFANQVGAEVCVVDVGVASDLPATPGLLPRKVRAGTADMTTGPAMTREEVTAAIEVGIETARDLVAAGNKALLTGEMGIANTTASAALISVFTDTDPSEVTGRGTGINDETLARKTEVVRRAIELHQPDPADPIGVLAAIGGLEHAAMVGLLLGGASLRTPVILDGVSAGAAALVARAIAPEVLAACIAGHRSAEPGHVAALNKLGLRPLIDLDLRLGEGTGALLALPVVQSAARAMHEVATFDSAGVTEK